MAGALSRFSLQSGVPGRRATSDSLATRIVLTGVSLAFIGLFLVFPLFIVFEGALAKGWQVIGKTFDDPATQSAIWLTLLVAAIAVPLNTLFGLAAAWSLTRFQFRGRSFLITLIDLPLWVSPVIGGLIYVLVYGLHGWFGAALREWDIRVIFAVPGIVLATVFVTFPFVARGLIPLMQAQGAREEEAALTLGANGFQIFWRVTVPKIKWGLIYGIILCNARSMGEFGAVSVVSGHIRGKTNTMPLHVEILYNEYQFAPAFAVAALLALLALATLAIKTYAEWKAEQQLREAGQAIESHPEKTPAAA
jgi:sulfate transport system permease protein